jgi:uncharacterized protein YndB with AHSA1/START domain
MHLLSADTPTPLKIVRRFNARPERVFDAWLAPEVNCRWLFSSSGQRVAHEIHAIPGGAWLMTNRQDGQDYTACGQYLEIARPRRLVFTFARPQFSPNKDRISVELAPDGQGCIQTFTQKGIDIIKELRETPDGEAGKSEQGWTKMFDLLEEIVARHIDS